MAELASEHIRDSSLEYTAWDGSERKFVGAQDKVYVGGNGFSDAYGGVPFPIPQSGVEAVWNHIARYRGTYIVRRAPTLVYDTPIEDSDGLRTADDTDMYNGAPDRYDWTLVGKKEIYIPYNNHQITSPEVKYKDLLTPGHVNPKSTRYELHRVWVVDGQLKHGARHIYSRAPCTSTRTTGALRWWTSTTVVAGCGACRWPT